MFVRKVSWVAEVLSRHTSGASRPRVKYNGHEACHYEKWERAKNLWHQDIRKAEFDRIFSYPVTSAQLALFVIFTFLTKSMILEVTSNVPSWITELYFSTRFREAGRRAKPEGSRRIKGDYVCSARRGRKASGTQASCVTLNNKLPLNKLTGETFMIWFNVPEQNGNIEVLKWARGGGGVCLLCTPL